MSSHHIVRDEQEPALIIHDPIALDMNFVESLLEWSPTVIVVESALEEVLKWGIKIDVVVARHESLEKLKPRLREQSPVQLLGFETGNLLDNTYQFLLEKGHMAVNVMADIYNSKALDLAKLYSFKLDSVIFYNNRKWVYAATGFFEKWVSTGHHFGVHPIAPNTFLTAEGFYNSRTNEMIMEPIELTSEVTGKVRIETNAKPLWVVEELIDQASPN